MQAAGFTGTYCRVTEFIRRWRDDGGAAVSKVFVPLHFELGEAFQFDYIPPAEAEANYYRQLAEQAAIVA